MKRKLIGGNIKPKCEYCKYSVALQDPGSLLCPRAGITAADGSCKKFKYDPLKRKPQSSPTLIRFSNEDFSLE